MPVPEPWPIWSIEHRDFVALNAPKSLLRLGLGRPARRDADSYARGAAPSRQQVKALQASVADGMADSAGFHALSERIVRRLQALPGVTVVFLEEPLSPDFLQDPTMASDAARFRAETPHIHQRANGDVKHAIA